MKPLKTRCPQCGKSLIYSPDNPFRPFCSERCQWVDLGKWANEEYAVPGEPASVQDPMNSPEEDSESQSRKPLH